MLKGDRHELDTDISYFMNQTSDRGYLVCLNTTASGAAMDSASALVEVKADPSGETCLGFLLNDVVDINQTRQHVNQHKDEVVVGGKVTVLSKGFVVTDSIDGAPTAGAKAYIGASGLVSATAATGHDKIGTFLSSKDADGFAKVSINLP